MGEARRRREEAQSGVSPHVCARCGYGMDSATAVGEGREHVRPKPGDFSLCMRCGLPMRFEEGGKLRTVEPSEIEDLGPEARKMLFIACAALGSQNNPMRQTAPGRRVAEVVWGEIAGTGKGLIVHASGAADVGLAVVVLCQGITQFHEYDEPTKEKAREMIAALTDGRSDLPPFEVFRGNGPAGSA